VNVFCHGLPRLPRRVELLRDLPSAALLTSWESPAADLAAAEKLINACGYHRRDQELADAKQAVQE